MTRTQPLPKVYRTYLNHYAQSVQPNSTQMGAARRMLVALNDYLKRSHIRLRAVKIENIDAFLAGYNAPYALSTRRLYRSCLRRFLSYLYHQIGMLKRDLAPLVVGPPSYALAEPPKFLRSDEIERLFDAVQLDTPSGLRTCAMLHLAYTLGLRPREISLITLDVISFVLGELKLEDRKNNNPITMPLPEETLKAIAAYIIGGRPSSQRRALFLNFNAPYEPIAPGTVGRCISVLMRKANLESTAYWLRHTYAQNLLESGASIFEIKHMMGHVRIQSTKRYLHIHIKMMREVILDETF